MDSLEAFRASLVIFLTKARRSIDDVGDEIRRTRAWLQTDRRIHWDGEFRRRTRMLDQAQQELMTSRLSGNREAILVRQGAVNKARRALDEAGEKLQCLKKWNQNYDRLADPAVRRLESLRQVLDQDLPKAIAYLANSVRTLEAYAETPPAAVGKAATAGTSESV